jgi:plasmid stabilization system protein ParE
LSVPVLLRRAAELDLEAIEDWYDSRRAGLVTEFRAAVDEIIARISADPLMYPERYRGNRRARLRRFPYLLWYRVYDDYVVVLACIHGKRDPRFVRGRLEEGA